MAEPSPSPNVDTTAWTGCRVVVSGYEHPLRGKRGVVKRVTLTPIGPAAVIVLWDNNLGPAHEYTIDPHHLIEEK